MLSTVYTLKTYAFLLILPSFETVASELDSLCAFCTLGQHLLGTCIDPGLLPSFAD